MIIYLEDLWNYYENGEDIINYANNKNIIIHIFEQSELLKIDSKEFLSNIFFCSTNVVQTHLLNLNKLCLVPDTYETIYSKYFYREIEKIKITDFIQKYYNNGIQRFVKPTTNNKDFDGRIISNLNDLINLKMVISNYNQEVYSCEVIDILSEARLLIGNFKLYGHNNMCKNIDNTYLDDTQFINDLINLTGEKFRCIDICLIKQNNQLKWGIVEINPPFSLDDYEILFENYIDFCIDSCNYIKNMI